MSLIFTLPHPTPNEVCLSYILSRNRVRRLMPQPPLAILGVAFLPPGSTEATDFNPPSTPLNPPQSPLKPPLNPSSTPPQPPLDILGVVFLPPGSAEAAAFNCPPKPVDLTHLIEACQAGGKEPPAGTTLLCCNCTCQ